MVTFQTKELKDIMAGYIKVKTTTLSKTELLPGGSRNKSKQEIEHCMGYTVTTIRFWVYKGPIKNTRDRMSHLHCWITLWSWTLNGLPMTSQKWNL